MNGARRHRRSDRPPTLDIRALTVEIAGRRGTARVIDAVDLEVWPGEIVGLIGESGSGKTMTAFSVLDLLPRRAKIAGGSIRLEGTPLTQLSPEERRRIRGDRVA